MSVGHVPLSHVSETFYLVYDLSCCCMQCAAGSHELEVTSRNSLHRTYFKSKVQHGLIMECRKRSTCHRAVWHPSYIVYHRLIHISSALKRKVSLEPCGFTFKSCLACSVLGGALQSSLCGGVAFIDDGLLRSLHV